MKKLLLLTALFLSTTLFAQNITNTLGNSGTFEVIENDGQTMFSVVEEGSSQTPYVIVGNNANAIHLHTKRQLNIVEENGTAGLNLYSYKGSGFGSFNKMNFFHARGTVGTPAAITTSDELGRLTWWGYNGDWDKSKAAEIYVGIDAITSNTSTAGKIIFGTTPIGSEYVVDRMTIESNGRVNISSVMKLTPQASAPTSNEEGDIYVNSSDHHIYCYLDGAWKQLDN